MTRSSIFKIQCLVLLVAVVLALSACAAPAPATTPAPTPSSAAPTSSAAPYKWPDPLQLGIGDTGSANYNMGVAFADGMLKKGITVRTVPVGTDPGRIALLTGGRVQFGYLPSATVYVAREGAFDFAKKDWGPQDIYEAEVGIGADYSGLVTAKDANIKTWADAKGKRLAHATGSANSALMARADLAFGGLTWNDVKIVEVPTFAAGGQAIIDGKADMAVGGSMSTWAQQLAVSPRGVAYPIMPFSDKEAWKRAQAIAPFYEQTTATKGAGVTQPFECGTYSFANVNVLPGTDADLVYNFVKTQSELYPLIKDSVYGIEQLDPARFSLNAPAPYHAGAIKYFKEIGKWTAANQAYNDKLIARGKVLKDAWAKTLSEATKQNISDKDFTAFWAKMRADALKAAGMDVLEVLFQ